MRFCNFSRVGISRALSGVLCIALLAGLTAESRGDDLFSRRPLLGDVPSQPQQNVPRQPPASQPARTADLAMVESMLNRAGFETQRVENGVLLMQVETGKLRIPTLASLSEDKSQLWLIMVLKTVPNVSEMNANRMMALMEANQKYGPAFFTFNRQSKRIDLRRAVRNVDLDAEQLKLQMDVLSLVAGATVDIWSGGTLGTSPQTEDRRAQTPPQTPRQPAVSPVVGRWAVELKNGEGFALRLDAGGSFVLVHRKPDGTQDVSRGKYTFQQGQLNLQVAGQPALVGRVTFSSADAFNFAVGGGNGLNFRRIEEGTMNSER